MQTVTLAGNGPHVRIRPADPNKPVEVTVVTDKAKTLEVSKITDVNFDS